MDCEMTGRASRGKRRMGGWVTANTTDARRGEWGSGPLTFLCNDLQSSQKYLKGCRSLSNQVGSRDS